MLLEAEEASILQGRLGTHTSLGEDGRRQLEVILRLRLAESIRLR